MAVRSFSKDSFSQAHRVAAQAQIKLSCSSTPDQHACCRAQLNWAKTHFRKWSNSVCSLKNDCSLEWIVYEPYKTSPNRPIRSSSNIPSWFVRTFKHKGHDIGLELIRDDKGQRWKFKLAVTPAGIKSAVSSWETSGRKIKGLRGIIQE